MHIHKYGDPRVFVFGSNRLGIHGAGAALYARTKLGALQGRGEGPMPDDVKPGCYALPTCYEPGVAVALIDLGGHIETFIEYAKRRFDLKFFVSEVGCGLAGFTAKQIIPMFGDAPGNCDLPPGWR